MADIVARGLAKKNEQKIEQSKIKEVRTVSMKKDADITAAIIRLTPFDVQDKTAVNRIKVEITKTVNAKLCEIAIYNNKFQVVVRSGVREVQSIGEIEIALPYTILDIGTYYIGVACSDATVTFGGTKNSKCLTAAYTLPLPASISTVYEDDEGLAFSLLGYDLKPPTGFEFYEMPNVRAFCKSEKTAIIYGWNTQTGRICRSETLGATWEDLMIIPAGAWGMAVDDTYDRLVLLTGDARIYISNGLLSSSTFTEITPAEKRPEAVALPYSIKIWGGYLWFGEYSQAQELAGGPKLLRYDLVANTWKLSKQFPNCRHIHSFTNAGTSSLYVSIGDAGYGSDIGYHRLLPAGINPATDDSWIKWSGFGGTFTDHYAVDSIQMTIDGDAAILGACDRPGIHLLCMKIANTAAGIANISAKLFGFTDSGAGETVRNVILDARNNCYYVTAETDKYRICVSPPPYVESYILYDFPYVPSITAIMRSGEWLMFNKYRFKTVDFGAVTITTEKRNYLYNSKEVVGFTAETVGAQTSLSQKNAESLYVEAKTDAVGTQKTGYYTTVAVNTTGFKKIVIEGEFLPSTGICKVRAAISSTVDGEVFAAEAVMDAPNKYVNSKFKLVLAVTSFQAAYYIHAQALSTDAGGLSKVKIEKIYLTKI